MAGQSFRSRQYCLAKSRHQTLNSLTGIASRTRRAAVWCCSAGLAAKRHGWVEGILFVESGGGDGGTDPAEVTAGAGVGSGGGGGGTDPAELTTGATGVVAVVAHCGCGGGDIFGGDIGGGGDTLFAGSWEIGGGGGFAGSWEIGGGGGGAVGATGTYDDGNGTFPCNGKVSMEVSHLTASSRAVPSMWPM